MDTNTNTNKTKVRYGVHYNDRNYEYALHSGKSHFLRNLADVVNVVEYCVVQDLKKNNYKDDPKFHNIEIIRFVNDQEDENWKNSDASLLMESFAKLIGQMVADTIQRNS